MHSSPDREPHPRLTGAGRTLYSAGALALTEPGPAAAGLVVTDARGRVLAHRAHYLGRTTQLEAATRALLTSLYVAVDEAMQEPTLKIDQPALLPALEGTTTTPAGLEPLMAEIQEVRARLGAHHLEVISPAANLARPVALAPLVEWLPERTRRAERLRVTRVGADTYDVASETQPDQSYRVWLRRPDGMQESLRCECADFQYRGLPCKHLLAVAQHTDALEALFQAEPSAFPRPPGAE